MRVLRISHSSVVPSWRERERALQGLGVELTLLSAKSWHEGGAQVKLGPEEPGNVIGVATFGHHPCGFAYDPIVIWKALRSVPHDMLDVHEEPYSLAAFEVVLLRWLARRREPLVFYSAQNLPKRYRLPIRAAEKVVLKVAKGAYPCNEAAAANLRRKGFRGVVLTTPLGVTQTAPSKHPPAKTADVPGRGARGASLRVGCVGRLVPEKGFHTVVEAVASELAWRLSIVGDGPEREHLARLSARLGAAERVELLGYRPQAALGDFYSSIDVLVVPSLPTTSWEEQFGRVAIEAMAAGVPVVASTCGSLPEVVGDAGLLFPHSDPEALSSVLRQLDRDPSLYQQLAEKGLKRAKLFSWENVAKRQRCLYGLVSGRPGPPTAGDDGQGGSGLPELHVVTVAYGHPEMLDAALEALHTGRSGLQLPVVVVDNSSDGRVQSVAEAHGAVYVRPGENLGFAAAVNLALAHHCPRGADVLLLNPDAQVDPATVMSLQRRLHSEARLACVAPAQKDLSGKQQQVAWPFPTPARAWLEALGLGRLSSARDFLVGSVLLLNGAALEEVGHFDSSFFLYAEETDWQRRARSEGWGARLCEDLNALHVGGGTTSEDPGRREVLFAGAIEHYFRKWHGARGWQVARSAMVAGALLRATVLHGPRRRQALLRAKRLAQAPLQRAEKLLQNEKLIANIAAKEHSTEVHQP